MEIDYSTNKQRKKFSTPTELKTAFGVNAKRVSQRLEELEASANLKVMQQIPAARCHPLKGDRAGEWSVDVSGNDRLLFLLDHNPIPLLEDNSIDAEKVTKIKIQGVEDVH